MRHGKKLITAILPAFLIAVVLLLEACGGGGTTPGATGNNKPAQASADKQIFRYPIGNSDFITLDPGLAQYSTSIYAIKALFSGLVGLNGKGEIVDLLAASHSASSDGLTYTFTLRD